MNKIHIGTSGWSYKTWLGPFYPLKLPSNEYLTFYARHFDTTEINTCFYHLPRPSTIERWLQQTPDDFMFCPKMNRQVTHVQKLQGSRESLDQFFQLFEPLKDKMGPVLIQLPASLSFHLPVVISFFQYLKDKYDNYELALEVRHPSWFTEESLDIMQQYGIALVFAQSVSFPYRERITASSVYLRFHGSGVLYGSGYDEAALKEYAAKMIAWSRHHTIWAFFNNDMNGHALRDARTLQKLIGSLP
jgi:uncharacterized protein YecE (DUF72 family)